MNKPAASHDETTPSLGGIPVRRLAVPLGVLTASAAAFAALMYVPRVESPPLASANVKKAESVPTSEVSAQIDPNSFVDAFGPTVPNECATLGPLCTRWHGVDSGWRILHGQQRGF
jgi:hypothetical protein